MAVAIYGGGFIGVHTMFNFVWDNGIFGHMLVVFGFTRLNPSMAR